MPANDSALQVDVFGVTNPPTYNNAASVSVYYSMVNSHVLSCYLLKTNLNIILGKLDRRLMINWRFHLPLKYWTLINMVIWIQQMKETFVIIIFH